MCVLSSKRYHYAVQKMAVTVPIYYEAIYTDGVERNKVRWKIYWGDLMMIVFGG